MREDEKKEGGGLVHLEGCAFPVKSVYIQFLLEQLREEAEPDLTVCTRLHPITLFIFDYLSTKRR